MRTRILLLVVAVIIVGGLALLNWPELVRPASINLVWRTVQAPLGLVLLALLGITVLAALVSGAALRAQHARHERHQAAALRAQRDLAERAEASRFLDLRQMLDQHMKQARERDQALAQQADQSLARARTEWQRDWQREWRSDLQGLHHALSARMEEMQAHLEARIHASTAPLPREPLVNEAPAATRDPRLAGQAVTRTP